jgi:hypothetical protein
MQSLTDLALCAVTGLVFLCLAAQISFTCHAEADARRQEVSDDSHAD